MRSPNAKSKCLSDKILGVQKSSLCLFWLFKMISDEEKQKSHELLVFNRGAHIFVWKIVLMKKANGNYDL